ncbi:ATP-binding protein [Streptomyces sp. TRM68367]|uniref:ATP-binding protein n=1 Tax=Streptomyces sp. TRM68367 TaxID=2758415 RepID=UPI00165C721A|nr:ATP-binding protein [Streptomyces sp. TRM68367]MBC9723677.1 ATP-binding protein [Streptomyces sp. TRM68367]
MPAAVTYCQVPTATDLPPTPPSPESLAYSLTLPAAPHSPAIARAATRTILRAHGLEDVTDAAVQVVSELASSACRFTPAAEVYVSLRYREAALRVTLYDNHPRHTHPRLAIACDTRRRAALRVLACVVRACDGDWGFGDAREPGGGTRMWAVLPRLGARAYLDGERTGE